MRAQFMPPHNRHSREGGNPDKPQLAHCRLSKKALAFLPARPTKRIVDWVPAFAGMTLLRGVSLSDEGEP